MFTPSKLFTVVLKYAFKLDWERKGVNIYGEYFNHLRFADDIILISDSPKWLPDKD